MKQKPTKVKADLKRRKQIQYREGQWFAVPLRKGGYALGIVTRGNNKSKGGLGYFFGPKYGTIPNGEVTREKNPEDAVLITRFGDLGIINGSWPLIQSTRPFSLEEWPIPKFGLEIPLIPGKGYIREYNINAYGEWVRDKETLVDAKEIADLPEDSYFGGGAVEIKLTDLLNDS